MEELKTRQERSLPSWLTYSVIALVVLGVFFRFYNLDRKIFWIDETHTSLRISGHTRQEMVDRLYTGDVVGIEQIQSFQRLNSERGWDDTLNALKGNAEHSPLYFLLARLWVEMFGYSVTVMRSLPVLISLFIFPSIYWLCWELFQSPAVGAIAMGIVAVSPLHVLYAQEARPYSLWTVLIITSSAALLWALRTHNTKSWMTYSVSLAAGFYTQLLFVLIAIAHALYVLATEVIAKSFRVSRRAIAYCLSSIAALIAFTPWIVVVINNWEQVEDATESLTEEQPILFLVNQWFFNLSRGLLDRDLGAANWLLGLAIVLIVYYLCRTAPWRSGLFVLLLIMVPFGVLALLDVGFVGQRSIRIRYLFPSFIGVQVALAYLFATQAVWAKTIVQKIWRIVFIAFIVNSIILCAVSSQAQVWWTKSNTRSGYYPLVSSLINQAENPLIVTESLPPDVLALSYWLEPDTKFQLVEKPQQLAIAPGYSPIYLLNPSRRMLQHLVNQNYKLIRIYTDYSDPMEFEHRLWIVQPRDRSPF